MKPITFKAPHSDGTIQEVTGYPTGVPGLVVQRDDAQGTWFVTHVRSGLLIPFGFDSPEGALALAIAIVDLTDWRQSIESIGARGRLWPRIAEHGYRLRGCLLYRPHGCDQALDNEVIA